MTSRLSHLYKKTLLLTQRTHLKVRAHHKCPTIVRLHMLGDNEDDDCTTEAEPERKTQREDEGR